MPPTPPRRLRRPSKRPNAPRTTPTRLESQPATDDDEKRSEGEEKENVGKTIGKVKKDHSHGPKRISFNQSNFAKMIHKVEADMLNEEAVLRKILLG